jgi:uncharacterized DUF497 family protein
VGKVYKWYTFYTHEFEFDPAKSDSNMTKHGIDFVEAQQLWEDPNRLVEPARTLDETRYMIVGMIGDNHWSGFFTRCGNRVRIISVRRSRKKEISLYEDQG